MPNITAIFIAGQDKGSDMIALAVGEDLVGCWAREALPWALEVIKTIQKPAQINVICSSPEAREMWINVKTFENQVRLFGHPTTNQDTPA